MRKFWLGAAVSVMLLALATGAQAQQIQGDYIESRSADVYVAACFANSEVGLTGNQAILGWRVRQGSFNNVNLDGLSVVAVAKASATLGDPYHNPYPAKAVLIVDSKANPQQQDALVGLAQKMAGELLKDIVRVEVAPISLEVQHEHGHPVRSFLRAGDVAGIETRPIGGNDHKCGNEVVFYQPLIQTTHAMPAVALLDQYSGTGLGVSWKSHDKPSAFVGSFSF